MRLKTEESERKAAQTPEAKIRPAIYEANPGKGLRPGITCPRCHAGIIDYDSMLHLVCPNCGLTEAGVCT